MNRMVAALVGLLALVMAACGGSSDDGGAANVDRTVQIDMIDTAFSPKTLDVDAGERVRFVFHNRGKVAHDAFIGDSKAQEAHEHEMRGMEDDGHGGHGDESNALTVDPGGTEELVHTFDRTGTYEIGCHQAGHYPAGMKVAVEVG